MGSSFTLFEHEHKPFEWSDRDLAQIERLNRTAATRLLSATIRNGKHCLQASEQVGVMRFGKHTVQVMPKIYQTDIENNEIEKSRQASANLLYLLAFAGELEVKEQTVTSLYRRPMDWFEILTRLFAVNLLQEWQQGAYRNYQNVHDCLPVLKGKLQIPEQIRHPAEKHHFYLLYDEFTADNNLNRIFRYTVNRLRLLTHDSENYQKLTLLSELLEQVKLININREDVQRVTINRLNLRFKPLLNLAAMFLDGGALQLTSGDEAVFSFMFDMNALYEGFLVNFIRKYRQKILPEALQQSELYPQGRSVTTFLARNQNGQKVFRMKPDLVFKVGGKFPLLLDAKYKRLRSQERRLGVSQSDFYQMYAYSQRFHSPAVLLVYPQTLVNPEPMQEVFTLEETDKKVYVETIDLCTDLGSYYSRERLITQLHAKLLKTCARQEI